jgi:hypothetical protein
MRLERMGNLPSERIRLDDNELLDDQQLSE